MSTAADVFLAVASACAIILTIVCASVGYALFVAAREIGTLTQRARQELSRFARFERRMGAGARFVAACLRIAAAYVIGAR